jgi:hypothetical protein
MGGKQRKISNAPDAGCSAHKRADIRGRSGSRNSTSAVATKRQQGIRVLSTQETRHAAHSRHAAGPQIAEDSVPIRDNAEEENPRPRIRGRYAFAWSRGSGFRRTRLAPAGAESFRN